jgi:hypothetical protein
MWWDRLACLDFAIADMLRFERTMNSRKKPARIHHVQKAANEALEAARDLAPGNERIEALKRAGILRKIADETGVTFAKRGRPAK